MHAATVSTDIFYTASDIRMLPIIDLDPKDLNCIFSTLCFIEDQAKKLNMETACITFDQQLWIKAVEVVNSKDLNVVPRLGGFHMIMNFLGSLGKLMDGSGLAEAFETCYGSVTIAHMLNGKAESRALRAHLLVQSALCNLLLKDILQSTSDSNTTSSREFSLDELITLYNTVLENNASSDVDGELSHCLDAWMYEEVVSTSN